MLEKRVFYAHQVQKANNKLIKAQTPVEEARQYTLRDKAMEFAKSIPRPLPKKLEKLEIPEKNAKLSNHIENSLIKDLDSKHQAFKKSVEEIRRKFMNS